MTEKTKELIDVLGYESAAARLLPTYEIIVDGKRKAIVELNEDESMARVIDDSTSSWMSIDKAILLAFEKSKKR